MRKLQIGGGALSIFLCMAFISTVMSGKGIWFTLGVSLVAFFAPFVGLALLHNKLFVQDGFTPVARPTGILFIYCWGIFVYMKLVVYFMSYGILSKSLSILPAITAESFFWIALIVTGWAFYAWIGHSIIAPIVTTLVGLALKFWVIVVPFLLATEGWVTFILFVIVVLLIALILYFRNNIGERTQ